MSTNITPTPTPTPTLETVEKTYKYFDLATFQLVKEVVKVSFTPAADFAHAVERLDNDEVKILDALNSALKRASFGAAKREVAKKGASRKIVFDLVRPMRNMLPFSAITDRKEQTAALLELVKSTPVLINSVRDTSLAAAEADTDEDSSEDEE